MRGLRKYSLQEITISRVYEARGLKMLRKGFLRRFIVFALMSATIGLSSNIAKADDSLVSYVAQDMPSYGIAGGTMVVTKSNASMEPYGSYSVGDCT